jgi:hypothetical protein
MLAIGVVGIAILGAGALAIAVTRGDPGEPTPTTDCVRWKVNTTRPVELRTEIVAATSSGARCGDVLKIGRIGRDGPFRVTVGTDVLWTSRCPDGRNPRLLELEIAPDGDLLAVVRCSRVGSTDTGTPPRDEVDLDQLLADEGYPPFLQDD